MMKNKYAKEVTILRQFIREGLFKENNIEVTSLEEMQKLQYKEHLMQINQLFTKSMVDEYMICRATLI